MPTITLSRANVTANEVTEALKEGLGPRYKIFAETAMNVNPVGAPRPQHPDTIVVGIGSARLFRAQVKVSHTPEQTVLHVTPGGLSAVPTLTNRLWIVRKVSQVVKEASGLH